MEPTLTPHLALAYLRELSTDVRGGIVLDREWRRLAGDPEIESGARALLAAGATTWLEVRAAAGWVFAARSPEGALVLVAGPHALPGLVRHDVDVVMAMLASAAPADTAGAGPGTPPDEGDDPARGTDAGRSASDLSGLADGIQAALPPVGERLERDR